MSTKTSSFDHRIDVKTGSFHDLGIHTDMALAKQQPGAADSSRSTPISEEQFRFTGKDGRIVRVFKMTRCLATFDLEDSRTGQRSRVNLHDLFLRIAQDLIVEETGRPTQPENQEPQETAL